MYVHTYIYIYVRILSYAGNFWSFLNIKKILQPVLATEISRLESSIEKKIPWIFLDSILVKWIQYRYPSGQIQPGHV